VPKEAYDVQVIAFKEDINNMNGEVKRSFDKLIEKIDAQTVINGDLKVEVAKLTQRVDDLVKNGVKNGHTSQ